MEALKIKTEIYDLIKNVNGENIFLGRIVNVDYFNIENDGNFLVRILILTKRGYLTVIAKTLNISNKNLEYKILYKSFRDNGNDFLRNFFRKIFGGKITDETETLGFKNDNLVFNDLTTFDNYLEEYNLISLLEEIEKIIN
jgi:CYTH domain-containing protein